jgi:hypothetical protein
VVHTGGDRQGREGHRIIANRWADEFLTSLVYVGELLLNRKQFTTRLTFLHLNSRMVDNAPVQTLQFKGLTIEGYEHLPPFLCRHHPPRYRALVALLVDLILLSIVDVLWLM